MQGRKPAVIAMLSILALTACASPLAKTPKPTPVNSVQAQAVEAAKKLWDQKYADKTSQQLDALLVDGPCLSNQIIPDWVADIAHQPRTAADDDPKNQCPAFLQGQAHHFVELDQYGNFLRGN